MRTLPLSIKMLANYREIPIIDEKELTEMTEKKIRLAQQADMTDILKIYEYARAFMMENGNPTQWVNGYPRRELLETDISLERLYVVEQDDRICGVFVFFIGDDPTYSYIEGSWRSTEAYGVIHRIAGVGGGVFSAALEFCKSKIPHIRIDTHGDNKPMQHAVEKAGFSTRGTIYVEDGSPRIAYDLL